MSHHRPQSSFAIRRRPRRNGPGNGEEGVIIIIVAMVLLAVIAAMAALSIDAVSLYTARSEAQLAADAAALAAARVIANSGATSDGTGTLMTDLTSSSGPAATMALQVAEQNQVGGVPLTAANIPPANITFAGTTGNPTVTVRVQVNTLPTFFSRIWNQTSLSVAATATAEVYNPSTVTTALGGTKPPIAPTCVKPWLLPNLNPGPSGGPIFDPGLGTISAQATTDNLLGLEPGTPLTLVCDGTPCTGATPLTQWQFFPGTTDPAGSFPAPNQSSVACVGCAGFDSFELAIAGCVQPPIACNANLSNISVDQSGLPSRNDIRPAVDGLAHSRRRGGDIIDLSAPTNGPFDFLAGGENPIVLSGSIADGTEIMVSDSLVTVPVFDTTTFSATFPQVQIIGFVQMFVSPTGVNIPFGTGDISTKVINLVGCGTTGTSGQAILGNGSSAVAVRLISQ